MSLPTLPLFIGLYADLEIKGPGVSKFDFSAWAETKFVCSALGLSKSSSDAAQLEVTGAGANVKLHFIPADAGTVTGRMYPYELQVRTGAKWYDVAEFGQVYVQKPA